MIKMLKKQKNIKTIFSALCIAAVAFITLAESAGEAFALDNSRFSIGRVKYQGGGDWYNDAEVVPNMLAEFEKRAKIPSMKKEIVVTPDQPKIFELNMLYLTGHGNMKFTDGDIENLRKYLLNGGFLYVDDDYGLDESFRRELKKLFPEYKLAEIPFDHPLFDCFYKLEKGMPKIHEHEPGPPRAFGIFHENRLVLLYTFNTNISDGWADPRTHDDPAEIREKAFCAGTNILYYSLVSNQAELSDNQPAPASEEINVK
ncbi:MAG TPA: DUF4159 domain-containing protein [Candidatus Wallbacteria bacterium]|nr:DUF4159 domain-containing protein [Candidatus Wallbacteria bacterium]